KHCDFVATNEGEETSLELLRILDGASDRKIGDVHGLVYRSTDGRIVYTPRRAVMTEIDFRLEPSLIHHYPGIVGNLMQTGSLRPGSPTGSSAWNRSTRTAPTTSRRRPPSAAFTRRWRGSTGSR